MSEFIHRQVTIEAQRFDPERVDELVKWAGGTKVPSVHDGYWITLNEQTAVPGDYIIKLDHGKFMAMSRADFELEYEPIASSGDQAYVLARLLQDADKVAASIPEIRMNHSTDPEGSGYHVELGGQRFTQAQWEAVQIYAAGTAELALSEEADERQERALAAFFEPDEYVGPLSRIVFEALGEVSACWSNLSGAGEFESTRARAIGEKLLDNLRPHLSRPDMQRMVQAFHEGMGQPVGLAPHPLPQDRVAVRVELIREEFIDELIPALQRGDLVETVDACIDILYVVFGLLVEMGVYAQPLFEEVQRSNMSKFGADGKAIISGPNDPDGIFEGRVKKGPNYFKPELQRILLSGEADLG
ncbi:MazG-like nucleotide pyrophosphohydrolase [Microbacterium phage Schimmels22]|nr:MazG-like nucleotide pyrophosphohydrolase [Microbacterium phage Schimmels22]